MCEKPKKNSAAEILSIDIPDNKENLLLPSPELLLFYQNLQNRVIWLDSDVDQYWLDYEKYIINWNREDIGLPKEARKPIWLFCYSYGGDLDVNWSFISLIQSSETPIYAVNMGQACSAMCFIYLACQKRYTMKHSTFLIHQGSGGGFEGTYAQVVAAIDEYQRKIGELYDYLLETTKIPENVLQDNIGTEWFLSAEEAQMYGMCDKVVDSINEVLEVSDG